MNKFSPKHYQRGKIQVWDFIADQNLDFFLGNVVKYVCRAGHKDQEGELDDLLKAKAYIDKKIELILRDTWNKEGVDKERYIEYLQEFKN